MLCEKYVNMSLVNTCFIVGYISFVSEYDI